MVSIRYPDSPRGVNIGLISDLATQGYERGQTRRDDAQAEKAFGLYLQGQGQPQQPGMSLAALAPQEIQRSPLAPVQEAASSRVSQAHGDMDGNQIFGRFIKAVRDGGVTNPNALAAIASTGKHESGFSPQNASGSWSDPSQSGQPGTAGGIMSWRAERLDNLRKFAQQNGDNPNAPSPETQGKFLLTENPRLIQALQQAKSPQEAQQLMNEAWKFAGYNQPGGEAGQRMATAQGFAGQFATPQSGPGQQAIDGMTTGQTPQAAPQGGSGLPPREVMLELFKSPQTRPLAIQLAQSAQKLAQGDPMAQVELETAKAKLEQLRNPKADLMNAGDGRFYNPDTQEWITAPGGGDDYSKRKAAADQLGLSPDDPAYQGFILTGKMPREDAQTLTATDKKAILEADELVAANDSALQMLGSVLSGEPGQTLNDRAGSGATAGTQSWLARNDPTGFFDDEKGQATTELQNVVLGQALASLKATFGAAPTEGERKILVDLQASIDKTPAERKIVIGRAMEAAKRRLDFNKKRVDDLRGGSFYKPGGGGPASQPNGNRTTSGVTWTVEP